MGAPFVVGTPTTYKAATAGSEIVLDRPSGVEAGDILVAAIRTMGSTSPDDFALSGWTRRGLAFKASDGAHRVTGLYTHVVTDPSEEPTSYIFTKSVSDNRRVGTMFIVRGADLETTFVGGSNTFDAGSAPTISIPSFAISSNNPVLLVGLWGAEVTSPNDTLPVSTELEYVSLVQSSEGTSATRTTAWVGVEEFQGSSSGDISLTWTSASGGAATAFAIRGSMTTDGPPPVGFSSVAEALRTPGHTWAHRGGSLDWPEMSEYAYDNSVRVGYPILEISVNRTSDGKYPGVHDIDLNRTSQTSGLPPISEMTWAEVQNYSITLKSNGTPRPYLLLEEFLDKYTETHVVVVDPKYAGPNYSSEFLDILDAHGGPEKIIVKYHGVGSGGGLASAAADRGYVTWGFFYADEAIPSVMGVYHKNWSILGLSYDAPQSAWDYALSFNKPVVAHIVPSQAAYNTAIDKGAFAAQVSGVSAVAAVSTENTIPSEQTWDEIRVGSQSATAVYVGGDLYWP